MAEDHRTVAVEATKKDYFGLRHMPGGQPLDAEGKGRWPADQFTFRLITEGALRRQAEASAAESSLPDVAKPDKLPAPAKRS